MSSGEQKTTVKKVGQAEVLHYCIQNQLPFAIYKLPNTERNVLIVSKWVEEISLEDLFARRDNIYALVPFSVNEEKTLCFNCDYIIEDEIESDIYNQIKQIKGESEINNSSGFVAEYAEYKKQFVQLFSQIKSGCISKAILSRIKHIPGLGNELAAEFYYKLSANYPRAYTFMIYTPQSGLWTGASPELLFKVEEGEGTTVSLAGTKKSNGDESSWSDKEIDEQQIVTDFVTGVLNKYGIENATVNGPETIKAGKMSHLKTQYHFSVEHINSKLGAFVNDLHPTPAVCGLPKTKSMDVIKDIEQHQRTFYAGFLGRLTPNDIKLFVNIRSMKFVNNGVDLYLGGGITAGSEAEKEWQETELKAETMLSVIKEINK